MLARTTSYLKLFLKWCKSSFCIDLVGCLYEKKTHTQKKDDRTTGNTLP
jgi:hypothetical protein